MKLNRQGSVEKRRGRNERMNTGIILRRGEKGREGRMESKRRCYVKAEIEISFLKKIFIKGGCVRIYK